MEEKKNEKELQKKYAKNKSKYYNPTVGEFGFCCEAEKVAIIYNYIRQSKWGNYDLFEKNFTMHYPYEAISSMKWEKHINYALKLLERLLMIV